MDHLLRNSEKTGGGATSVAPSSNLRPPVPDHSGACARVREAEYRWTAPKRCIYCIKAKVYTHYML